MRIISGYAKGIRLATPPVGVRPTTDRTKESLFGSLEPIAGTCVVDLFSGSGALGLEALSRGAREVHLVERDRRTVRLIEQNLAAVRKSMLGAGVEAGYATVHSADALSAARLLPGVTPDIVLADPPYDPADGDPGGPELLRNVPFRAWVGGALVVLEQSARLKLPADALQGWTLERERRIGDTVLYYLHLQA